MEFFFFQVQLQVLELKSTPTYRHHACRVMRIFHKRTGSKGKASIEMCLVLIDPPFRVVMLYMRLFAGQNCVNKQKCILIKTLLLFISNNVCSTSIYDIGLLKM